MFAGTAAAVPFNYKRSILAFCSETSQLQWSARHCT